MRQKKRDEDTEGRPHNDRGQDWSTRSWNMQERSYLRDSGGSVPLGHLDLRLRAPELGEDKFLCVKPPACGPSLEQLQNPHTGETRRGSVPHREESVNGSQEAMPSGGGTENPGARPSRGSQCSGLQRPPEVTLSQDGL